MEAQGVISKVQQPTLWCAGMVRMMEYICVDLKLLNCYAMWEHHLLPKIDETLAQLSGATTFSK